MLLDLCSGPPLGRWWSGVGCGRQRGVCRVRVVDSALRVGRGAACGGSFGTAARNAAQRPPAGLAAGSTFRPRERVKCGRRFVQSPPMHPLGVQQLRGGAVRWRGLGDLAVGSCLVEGLACFLGVQFFQACDCPAS